MPEALARLTGLYADSGIVDLGNNSLTGTFPFWLLTNTSAANDSSSAVVRLQVCLLRVSAGIV